jgi:hypothetical protein
LVLLNKPSPQGPPNLNRAFAITLSERLFQDIYSVLRQMKILLSDSVTYKHFLSCRGTVAQQLLDLLQDVRDRWPRINCANPNSASFSIHPTNWSPELCSPKLS